MLYSNFVQSFTFMSDCLQSGFAVEWDHPAIRVVYKDGTKSEPRGDFAIKLYKLVEAGTQTGYLLNLGG